MRFAMIRDLLPQLIDARRDGRKVCYTALVDTRGSTPQKAGAAMLVFEDGTQAGTLGGGCVEAEVKRRALEVLLSNSAAEIQTFQLNHDYGWDDGLICGGRMTMLIDPLPHERYYEQFQTAIDSRTGCTEAVFLTDSPFASARCLFDATGNLLHETQPETGTSIAMETLRPLCERPQPYLENGVSFLPQLEQCRLIIIGAGHVGQQLSRYAHDADFIVDVVDDRAMYCNAERFPDASALITGPFDEQLPKLKIDSNTFIVIVTRGHNHDEEALHHVVQSKARYIGMIGSRRKIKLIYADLEENGIPASAIARVHAPVGLDIGSQTVPEIAISITAQLISIRNQSVKS